MAASSFWGRKGKINGVTPLLFPLMACRIIYFALNLHRKGTIICVISCYLYGKNLSSDSSCPGSCRRHAFGRHSLPRPLLQLPCERQPAFTPQGDTLCPTAGPRGPNPQPSCRQRKSATWYTITDYHFFPETNKIICIIVS